MSDDTILVDTNIIVYAYDTFDKKKHEICKDVIEAGFRGELKLAVSNQILAELFFVLTKKLKNPFSPEDAESIVIGIADSINWTKINYTHETAKKAVSISKNSLTSFWDMLIAATALENDISQIFTENTKDFEKIQKMSAKNPMKP